MLDINKDFDKIESLVYTSCCPPENMVLDDWYFAVGNEMWCELFYISTHKNWQKELMLKAANGIAFETYLRPYSDENGNIYFEGNYKNCYYNIIPKSSKILAVYMQNLDTGNKTIQFIQKNVIEESIKNKKRVSLPFV